MESLRVFLSSTCYDLAKERLAIKKHLQQLGHLPILSDKNNIRYDPDKNTHQSCLDTVEQGTDYLVAIVSARFGGTIFRDTFLKHINTDVLKAKSRAKKYFEGNNKYSISQCEAFKAIEKRIPYLIFVHKDVLDERKKYQDAVKAGAADTPYTLKNPNSKDIFEFIGYVNNLLGGNGTYEYRTVSDIKKTISAAFSNHFRETLKDKIKAEATGAKRLIPTELSQFSNIIFEKLKADYKKQKSRIVIDNKLVFDENCHCTYTLTVNIKPISDCPIYHFCILADKDGEISVKKFRNIENQREDTYIGFKGYKTLDLFLFNSSANLKAPFNIEIHLFIENYLSDLLEEGKGQLTKSLHGGNTTFTAITQKMMFKKDAFKNLQIICRQHPDRKKINEILKPRKRGNYLEFDYSYQKKAKSDKNPAIPAIRFELIR